MVRRTRNIPLTIAGLVTMNPLQPRRKIRNPGIGGTIVHFIRWCKNIFIKMAEVSVVTSESAGLKPGNGCEKQSAALHK